MHVRIQKNYFGWNTPYKYRLQVIFVICFVAFVGTFLAGREFSFDTVLHARHTLYSLPAAISFLYHGGGGYTALQQVADVFANAYPNITDKTLEAAIHLPSIDHTKLLYVPADDKGTIDLAIFSIALFGAHISSLYYGFFVLLGIAAVSFWWEFHRQSDALAAIAIYMLSLWACTPAFAITKELFSFDNPRVLGVLAVVPAMHIVLSFGRRITPTAIILCCVQSLLLVECLHNRATDIWPFIAIVALAGIAIFQQRSISSVWPVAIALCALALLPLYQRVAYDPAYFTTKGRAHFFWHNVGMGFGVDPYFTQKYGITISDPSMRDLVVRKANELGGQPLVQKIFGERLGPKYAGMASYTGIAEDLDLYDEVAKAVVFQMAISNPGETAKLFFFYKPRLFTETVLWTAGLFPQNLEKLDIADQVGSIATVTERTQKDIYLRPFALLPLTGIALLALIGTMPTVFTALLVMLGSSLIAPWIVYPAIHTLGPSLLLITTLCQLIALATCRILFRIARDHAFPAFGSQ